MYVNTGSPAFTLEVCRMGWYQGLGAGCVAGPMTVAARVAHMSVYTAASGAIVFATGSIRWAWGLDDYNAPTLRPSRLSAAA